MSELERSYEDARKAGTNVRAMAVINPGNPTGGCMTEDNIRDIVRIQPRTS